MGIHSGTSTQRRTKVAGDAVPDAQREIGRARKAALRQPCSSEARDEHRAEIKAETARRMRRGEKPSRAKRNARVYVLAQCPRHEWRAGLKAGSHDRLWRAYQEGMAKAQEEAAKLEEDTASSKRRVKGEASSS